MSLPRSENSHPERQARWRAILQSRWVGATGYLLMAVLLGAYGALLLLAPGAATGFWPWPLDDFHARLYSVTFLTPALGAGILLRGATRGELRALGLTLAGWGFLPLIGLALADAVARRIRWDGVDVWLWQALFAAMGIAGVRIAMHARNRWPEPHR